MILQPAESEILAPLVKAGMDVIELGNKKNKRGVYRDWYEGRGANYRSLDINGEDGAEAVDFRKEFFAGNADLVTNIGFTEHVGPEWECQPVCWSNVVRLVRPGGVLVNITPQPGHWEFHGMWQPTPEFYAEFAAANNMKVERLDKGTPLSKEDPRPVVRAVLRVPTPARFVWEEDFHALMHRTRVTERY